MTYSPQPMFYLHNVKITHFDILLQTNGLASDVYSGLGITRGFALGTERKVHFPGIAVKVERGTGVFHHGLALSAEDLRRGG
jgi:hypothetical protein